MVLRVMSVLVCFHFRLETLREEEWDGDVTVVSSDMREWDAPELVRMRTLDHNIPRPLALTSREDSRNEFAVTRDNLRHAH